MAGKELEKEAKEYAHQASEILVDNTDAFITSEEYLEKGYLAAAGRIEELEMTVGTLRTFSNEQATSIERLEKENTELKSRDCWKSCEYANPKAELIEQHIKDVQQLTKAKEIIKGLLPMASNFVFGTLPKLDEEVQIYRQAEQFIKEIENENL